MHVLIDTSVLLKWPHSDGESELSAARSVRNAHVTGEVSAHVLDLAMYELGNVLLRALRWPSSDVADQLDDLQAIVGPPIGMTNASLRRAAALGERHRLTFYDACWAAAALELGVPLVSADGALLTAGLAESPTDFAARLGLRP